MNRAWRFAFLVVFAPMGCHQVTSQAAEPHLPVAPEAEKQQPATSTKEARPEGPRYQTVLAHPCAIMNRDEIKCFATDGSDRILETSLSVADVLDSEERVVHIDDAEDRLCALLAPSGRVVCWQTVEQNLWAEREFSERGSLAPVSGATDFALMNRASCALDQAGTVACWGNNDSGQLGDGTRKSRGEPVAVELAGPAVDIEASMSSVCAVLESGVVQCWGGNETEGTPRRLKPETIRGLTPVRSLGTARSAQLEDGQWAVWHELDHVPERGFTTAELVSGHDTVLRRGDCWLDGTTLLCTTEPDDTPAVHLDRVSELDVDYHRTCARRDDGSVWCRGSRLPASTQPPQVARYEPTRVPTLTNVEHVSAADDGVCALHDGGTVSCWGGGDHLPHGPSGSPRFLGTPQRVPLPGPADQVLVSRNDSCARVAGNAFCWSESGQVHDLGAAVELVTRVDHACADTGTELRCLHATYGRAELPRVFPRLPAGVMAAGYHHCSVRRGRVRCELVDERVDCAHNDPSETACTVAPEGEPSAFKFAMPLRAAARDELFIGGAGVCVLSPGGLFDCAEFVNWRVLTDFGFGPQHDVVRAAVSYDSVGLVTRTGTVHYWTGESRRRVGERRDPGIEDAVSVFLGHRNGYAIRRDGTLWAWGPNDRGQRGLGGASWRASSTPVRMSVLEGGASTAQKE